ncbi:MAG: hypothetical protein ABIK09_03845 [Pseudomonadota bacterium]
MRPDLVSRSTAVVMLLAVLLVAPGAAEAAKYDLKLSRLAFSDGSKIPGADRYFAGLMGDLAAVLAPRFLGPATTAGSLGFQVDLDYSFTDIQESADRWQAVMREPGNANAEGAHSILHALQVHVRKGLPFSTEVGGTFTKLINSDLWGIGLELKVTPIEGFRKMPEVGIRASVNTFLGANDYSLLTATADMIISKEIGIAGLFKLSPYLGYAFQYAYANSNVVTVFNPAGSSSPITFDTANVFMHYGILGFQIVAVVFNTGFEAALSGDVQSYAFRIGVDF